MFPILSRFARASLPIALAAVLVAGMVTQSHAADANATCAAACQTSNPHAADVQSGASTTRPINAMDGFGWG
jgi:hypothetical protein